METKQAEMQAVYKAASVLITNEYAALDAPVTEADDPQTVMLAMPDGIRLRTVIYKPKANGPFPTIIQRSCYPFLELLHATHAAEYAKRGFAFVFQFCRGTGGSEGVWEPNVHDRADGKATLDWLNQSAWVENIGWFGSSYLAFTGWVVADILPAKVKTLYLTHYGTARFVSAYNRGLFRQDVLTSWAQENAGVPITADFEESAKYRPQIHVDTDVWKVGKLSWYRDWITNTNRTDPYWNSGFWKMLGDIPQSIKVPMYIGTSWYDHHLGSALQSWRKLSAASKKHSTLRIGAWNHMFQPCLESHPMEHLENSDTKTAYHWFTSLLKDKAKPNGKVLVYNIGADTWAETPEYPFAEDDVMQLYFSNTRGEAGFRSLLIQPDSPGSDSYVYDPDKPLQSHGAESLLRSIQHNGSLKQPQPDYRQDVLSYISEPLAKDTTILGRVRAALYAASDVEDTSFTMKLMEVRPDGTSLNIRGSITTLAYRENPDHPRMHYLPNAVVKAELDMWDVMYTLQKGSRIRVDISSSDFPQYAIHTNHAGVWSVQNDAIKARQTIYYGKECPTSISIPLAQER